MGAENELQRLKTENKTLKKELAICRQYDELTGLYNKKTFYQKAQSWIEGTPDQTFFIVCIDTESFKLVNDLYGIEQGDLLLQYIAGELTAVFPRENTIIGRMANDVFAMCVSNIEEREVENRILRIFRENPLDLSILPAIGFCRVTDQKIGISLLCDRAMIALESVKGNYLKRSAVYDSSLRRDLLAEHELNNDLKSALKNRQFQVYMQPKCDMATGKIIGAEALIRWNHPQKGMIPPSCFIPAMERNGFIKHLDPYVWEETAAWLRKRMDEGKKPLPISVNISRIDICGMDVRKILDGLVETYQIDRKLLELEVTESAYASGPEKVIQTTRELMEQGYTVLMDDFGSAYSSLNLLNDISVNILKIDMRFLERDNQKSKDILKSVVHMGKWLHLPTIAEGVERREQMDFLLEIGCTCAQGYYFYRPMPIPDFEKLLDDDCKVDYEGMKKLSAGLDMLLDFQELFHKDYMSDHLLNNILGAIVLYSFDGTALTALRGTEAYYRITGQIDELGQDGTADFFSLVRKQDRPVLLDALENLSTDEDGAEVYLRIEHGTVFRWLYLRLFQLTERGRERIFYATMSDVTVQMETMERLRISEEQFCLAMEATGIILFELDVKAREAKYSAYTQKIYGLEATAVKAPEGFIEQGTVCKESIEDFCELYNAIYRGEDQAVRIIHGRVQDGATVWNRITLTAVRGQNGETVKAVGMVETLCKEPNLTPELQRELQRQRQRR